MKHHLFFLILCFFNLLACAQEHERKQLNEKLVGGPCEGCEAVLEFGDQALLSEDTLPGFLAGKTKLKLTGKVFQKDGRTPAANVILYIYHTNEEGLYVNAENQKTKWADRHGSVRAWVKTASDGSYTFYTYRPAAYPDGREVEHIHIFLKEPEKNGYYIDDFVFEDDPLLTKAKRAQRLNRGGSGILKLERIDDVFVGKRDIILGFNIPNYD